MQRADLILIPLGASQQPAGDRHAVERPDQRAQAIGISDEALGPSLLDRSPPAFLPRQDARGVTLLAKLAGKPDAPLAAAEDQDPRH